MSGATHALTFLGVTNSVFTCRHLCTTQTLGKNRNPRAWIRSAQTKVAAEK